VAFCRSGVREAACFLRFIYNPEDATHASLAALADEELAVVAGLAHKLNAGRLLAEIDAFLRGKMAVLLGCNTSLRQSRAAQIATTSGLGQWMTAPADAALLQARPLRPAGTSCRRRCKSPTPASSSSCRSSAWR
jgi:hypothetical protein